MGIQDVEEGEISDSASVEEISEEDFKPKPEAALAAKAKPESRVWTMQDVYKYQYKSGYSAGLYNLAWAQAVQNKPLNEVFDLEADKEDNSNSKPGNGLVSKDGDRVVIDVSGDDDVVVVEKEDGELEEGEIDLDWEPAAKAVGEGDEGTSGVELRRALESISSSDSFSSFEGQCLKLEQSLEGLCKLVGLDHVPGKDSLAESFLAALQALQSDFSSMDPSKKASNKEIWKRLLSLVSGKKFSFLSSKQLLEIENMVGSMDTPSVVSAASDKDKDAQLVDGSSGASSAEPNDPQNQIVESFKLGLKSRVLIPLLDLHKDHDADSLPSPTRQAPPALVLPRSFSSADGMFQPDFGSRKLTNGTEDFRLHPYETEALKALSSYQQKFSRSPSFTSDRLPSPTPSEEGASGAEDVGGEVSNLPTGNSNLSVPVRSLPSPLPDSANVQAVNSSRSVHASSVAKLPARLSAKSRDPRLRIINADSSAPDMTQQSLSAVTNSPRIDTSNGIISSRKQRDIGDPNIGGSETKRPKLELGNPVVPMDVRTSSGGGGFLEGTAHSGWKTLPRSQGADVPSDPRKVDNRTAFTIGNNNKTNVTVSGTEPLRVPSTSAALSLPDLLKGITVNPTMLMNLLKMGEQHGLVAAVTQQKPADAPKINSMPFSSNSKLGVTPVSTAPLATDVFQRPVGNPQVPAQITSVDDTAKVRMKARDPRRILHENMLQRSASSGSELATNGVTPGRPQGEPPQDKRPVPSQPAGMPDISQQLTKNLQNLANMISPSQALPSPPDVSSNHVSLPLQTPSVTEMKNVRNGELQNEISPVVDTGVSIASRSPNSWGDVEHLFEGYDDQQKAAIQQERARRLEEQKKMFAARKLCLVLDLDHTLLNSAKFGEVEPIHDELLRKKEEQDREKPQRHLFRFPHMGMWTKLRPGIWTFLEKASQLYELHLYTMGNKLYATEMAKVLDPSGALFAGRVISRGDDGESVDGDDRYPKTKDLEGVLGMESAVVIIDDSVRVWPHNKLNLIVVERYTYFPSSRRQFGLLGPSLLEIDHDERPEAGTLASSLAVIERIHQIFFSQQTLDDVDVRNILATEQRKILGGCRIVFSRVFPVGEVNPHHHPLWQTAEQFGAVCCNHIDDQVTHVVANSLGTDKVNWALSTGRFVVHPGWVEASALLYRRANEHDFAIIKP